IARPVVAPMRNDQPGAGRAILRTAFERQPEYVLVTRVLPPAQPASISREGRVLSLAAGGRQPFGAAAFNRNPVQAVLAAEPGRKDDLAPPRRPGKIADAPARGGQSRPVAARPADQMGFPAHPE